MKTVPALILVLLISTTGTALGQSASDLEGDWERIFMRIVLPDTTIEETFASGSRLIKILTQTRFALGQQSEDRQEVLAGGGRYMLVGDIYTEIFEYHSSSWLVGRVVPFESRREGDLWYISGVLGQFRLEETWRRLQ